MSLTINLAARGRPELLTRTIEITGHNISLPDTKFIVSLDMDDKPNLEVAHRFQGKGVIFDIAPREDTLGAKYNRMLDYEGDVYLAMVDYAPHVTKGFDEIILDAAAKFPDGIGVVYGHLANLSFPQINAMTRRFAELQGYFYPPFFPYWFIDHWLDDVARITDRIAFADVVIDTSKRSGENGHKTQELRDLKFWSDYFAMAYPERRRIAHRIIEACDDPVWRKLLLLDNHPLVEERSWMLSQQVSATAAQTEAAIGAGPPDERYRRLKGAAERMIAQNERMIAQNEEVASAA